jgi:hypothetical protein
LRIPPSSALELALPRWYVDSMRAVKFAFRRVLATVVLVVTGLSVIWIVQYPDAPPALPGTQVRAMMVMGALGSDPPATPWWQIALAAAVVGIVGVALTVVIYPRRAGWRSESYARGFRTGTMLHRPLSTRSN